MLFHPVYSWDFVEGLFPFEMLVWAGCLVESLNYHTVFCPPSQLLFLFLKKIEHVFKYNALKYFNLKPVMFYLFVCWVI